MALNISTEVAARILGNAEAEGLSVDRYLQYLMDIRHSQESDLDRQDFIEAVEEGLADIEAGRTRPADEFMAELVAKLGVPR